MINLVKNNLKLQTIQYQEILKDLENWNGTYGQDMYEPTIFSLWDLLFMTEISNQTKVIKYIYFE